MRYGKSRPSDDRCGVGLLRHRQHADGARGISRFFREEQARESTEGYLSARIRELFARMNDRHSPPPTPDQRRCRPQMIVLPTVLLGGTHFGMQPSAHRGQRWQPHARRALCDELPRAPMGLSPNFSAFNGKAAVLVFDVPAELPRSGRSAPFSRAPVWRTPPARSHARSCLVRPSRCTDAARLQCTMRQPSVQCKK
jgi:hypothetical protein